MATNHYKLQKGKLKSLNPYVYIAVEKKNQILLLANAMRMRRKTKLNCNGYLVTVHCDEPSLNWLKYVRSSYYLKFNTLLIVS